MSARYNFSAFYLKNNESYPLSINNIQGFFYRKENKGSVLVNLPYMKYKNLYSLLKLIKLFIICYSYLLLAFFIMFLPGGGGGCTQKTLLGKMPKFIYRLLL